MMKIEAIKTKIFQKNYSIFEFLEQNLFNINLENNVLAITSKILSISEGQLVKKSAVEDKLKLIKSNADMYIDESEASFGHVITIKEGILIPSAGIDESNSEDDEYILYPKNPMSTAFNIWDFLKKKFKLKNFGVLVTDSHTTPFRYGVTGIALAWCGFKPVNSYIGKPDIFGKNLKITKVNVIDALAASSVFEMGESSECTPIACISEIQKIDFCQEKPTQEEIQSIKISFKDDLYSPIFSLVNWKKN